MNELRIPPAYRAACSDCGDDLDTRADGVGEWCTGFTVNRAQGVNHVRERKGTGVYLCRNCVQRRHEGRALEQGSLFGNPDPAGGRPINRPC